MNNKQKSSIKCPLNSYILFEILIELLPVQNQKIAPNLINNVSDIIEILKSKKRKNGNIFI